MTAPKGIEVGAVWRRKRGHQGPAQLKIVNIYRPDRACLVVERPDRPATIGTVRRVMSWRDLRRAYVRVA